MKSLEGKSLEEKVVKIGELLRSILIRPGLTQSEASEWASAVAINAGAIMGQLYKATRAPSSMDKQAADALTKNIVFGIGMGRGM